MEVDFNRVSVLLSVIKHKPNAVALAKVVVDFSRIKIKTTLFFFIFAIPDAIFTNQFLKVQRVLSPGRKTNLKTKNSSSDVSIALDFTVQHQ